jgi:hypothetical protein
MATAAATPIMTSSDHGRERRVGVGLAGIVHVLVRPIVRSNQSNAQHKGRGGSRRKVATGGRRAGSSRCHSEDRNLWWLGGRRGGSGLQVCAGFLRRLQPVRSSILWPNKEERVQFTRVNGINLAFYVSGSCGQQPAELARLLLAFPN